MKLKANHFERERDTHKISLVQILGAECNKIWVLSQISQQMHSSGNKKMERSIMEMQYEMSTKCVVVNWIFVQWCELRGLICRWNYNDFHSCACKRCIRIGTKCTFKTDGDISICAMTTASLPLWTEANEWWRKVLDSPRRAITSICTCKWGWQAAGSRWKKKKKIFKYRTVCATRHESDIIPITPRHRHTHHTTALLMGKHKWISATWHIGRHIEYQQT